VHYDGNAAQINHMHHDVTHGADPANYPTDPFAQEVLEQIRGTEVHVEHPDIRREQQVAGDDPLALIHDTLDRWKQAYDAKVAEPITPRTSMEAYALKTGFQNFREHTIVGSIGMRLQRFRHRPTPIAGGLLMGSAHPHMAAKMDARTGNTTRIVGERDQAAALNHLLMRAMGNMVLTPGDISMYYVSRLMGHS
jgi:hypothetical protein